MNNMNNNYYQAPAAPQPIKYPKTLTVAGRNSMIFSAQSNLRAMEQEDIDKGNPPLPTFKGWGSSVELSFSDSTRNCGGSGHIEADHIADVKLRTSVAMEAVMEAERRKKGKESSKSQAAELMETKVFFLPAEIREMKGKTAREIASLAAYAQVMNAAANLEANADRDPRYAANNRKQAQALKMAAVVEESKRVQFPTGETVAEVFAGDLKAAAAKADASYRQGHPAGQLSGLLYQLIQADPSVVSLLGKEESGPSGTPYKIYGPVMKTPNTNKLDMEGYTKAYSLAVTCDPERTDYPFRVDLTTMRGKPFPGKQVGVQGNTIIDRKTFTVDLQSWEWINLIDRTDWEKKMVELAFHDTAYQIMVQADADNYQQRRMRGA